MLRAIPLGIGREDIPRVEIGANYNYFHANALRTVRMLCAEWWQRERYRESQACVERRG